jgi:hypothetical protein
LRAAHSVEQAATPPQLGRRALLDDPAFAKNESRSNFGVLFPLIVADLARETDHYTTSLRPSVVARH